MGALAGQCPRHPETLQLPPREFNKPLSTEPATLGLVLWRRKWTNESEPAGEARTGANTLPLSPNTSKASSSLGEGHSCSQLAETVSQLPFRTQHLLSHPRTDRSDRSSLWKAVHLWVSTLPFPLSFSCPQESLKLPVFQTSMTISTSLVCAPPLCPCV